MDQEHLEQVQYLIRSERASEAIDYVQRLPGSDQLSDVLAIVQCIADIQAETRDHRIQGETPGTGTLEQP